MRQHLLTILLLVAAHLCAAQDNKTIETTIKALEQKAVKGILQSDTALLKEVWAPEFLVNTPRNNIANGRSAVFQNQRAGLINYSAFERVVEQVLVQKDMVITMGHETYTPGQDGKAAVYQCMDAARWSMAAGSPPCFYYLQRIGHFLTLRPPNPIPKAAGFFRLA
jgi:hypothetical protein